MRKRQQGLSGFGGDYFDQLDAARIEHRAVQRLEPLGYNVTLTPVHLPDQTAKESAHKTTKSPPDQSSKESANKTTQNMQMAGLNPV